MDLSIFREYSRYCGCRQPRHSYGGVVERLIAAVLKTVDEMKVSSGYLKIKSINLKRGTAYLPKTKNGEERTVPLSPKAIAILQSRPVPESPKESICGYSLDSITGAMRTACAAAGVTDLRFHDLRQEATSRLFENTDLDIMEIQMITGHKTLQMLAGYTHLRAERLVKRLAGRKR